MRHPPAFPLLLLLLIPFTLCTFPTRAHNIHRRQASDSEIHDRARRLLGELRLHEKLQLLHGDISRYTGRMNGVDRVGIPDLYLNDGPQGFRGVPGTSVAWPSGLAQASTWNPNLVQEMAVTLSQEFKEKGANVILGPALCIARVPTNGRTFEYLSGESPYLGARMAEAYVRGAQSVEGMIATAKHYILNNQETNRMRISSNIEDYVLHELYVPPFEAAVKAGVLAVMCSYNKVNGVHACENKYTLQTVLRDQLGFQGFVMSDWFATHSIVRSQSSGLDQEMPLGLHYGLPLYAATLLGIVKEESINKKVENILYAIIKANTTQAGHCKNCLRRNTVTRERVTLARKVAQEGLVLLKNEEETLPLRDERMKILLVGKAAVSKSAAAGGGSGAVSPKHAVTVLEGLRKGIRSKPGISVTFDKGLDLNKTRQRASDHDVTIVVLASTASEGSDRRSLSLGAGANRIVSTISEATHKVVVLVVSPGAFLMPWETQADAILAFFLPGQELGNSLASVLFGEVNPSGKLPLSFPNTDNEMQFRKEQYPGVNLEANYSEGLMVGYRWYTHHGTRPKYCFGHGLSYTTFQYSDLAIIGRYISFTLKNTGTVGGAEVAQLYLDRSPLSTAKEARPKKELAYFEKHFLRPGETKLVMFTLSESAIRFWDSEDKVWKKDVSKGYGVAIGSSILDIRLTGSVSFKSVGQDSKIVVNK